MFIYKIANKINNKVYIGQTRQKTGKPWSDEEKAKISASKKGKKAKPFSEAHKAKMRESALKRELRKRELKKKVEL